jgi:hypothetical protein
MATNRGGLDRYLKDQSRKLKAEQKRQREQRRRDKKKTRSVSGWLK